MYVSRWRGGEKEYREEPVRGVVVYYYYFQLIYYYYIERPSDLGLYPKNVVATFENESGKCGDMVGR